MAITVERIEAEIDVDPSKAIAAMEAFDAATSAATKDKTANLDVDAGKAEAELVAFDAVITEVTRDRTIHVDVDKDRAFDAISELERLLAGAGGGGGGGLQQAASGGGAFNSMLGNLGAMLVGILPQFALWGTLISVLPGALAAAAAGVGILVAALAPLVGLLGAIPVALGAFGVALGTVMAALGPVIAGVTAYKQATAGAAQSSQQLAAAQHNLMMSERALHDARVAYAKAPHQAEEALLQAHFQARQAVISEKQAVQALIDAQKNLKDAQNATSDSMVTTTKQTDYFTGKVYEVATASADAVKGAQSERAARLQVQQAELNLAEARDRSSEAQRNLHEMEQKGIKNSDIMVQARRQLADAEYQHTQALKALHDQMTGVTGATSAWTKAQKNLSATGIEFVHFIVDEFLPALGEVSKAAQDGLLPGVESGLKDILGILDSVEHEVRIVGGMLGGTFASLAHFWTRPNRQDDLGTMFRGLNTVLRLSLRMLQPLSRIMVAVTTAATPMVTTLEHGVLNVLNDLADWMETDHGKKSMLDFFNDAAEFTGLWLGVLKPIGGMIEAIARAGEPLAKGWLKNLGDDLQHISDWMNSRRGQQTIFDYMEKQMPVLSEVAGLIGDIVKEILNPKLGGKDSSFYKFVHAIRTDLWPTVKQIWEELDRSDIAAKVVAVVDPLARLARTMIRAAGPIADVVLPAIGGIADGLSRIPEPIVTALEAMFLAASAAKIGSKAFKIDLFGERGTTPINPLFVKNVGGPGGGAGGGVGSWLGPTGIAATVVAAAHEGAYSAAKSLWGKVPGGKTWADIVFNNPLVGGGLPAPSTVLNPMGLLRGGGDDKKDPAKAVTGRLNEITHAAQVASNNIDLIGPHMQKSAGDAEKAIHRLGVAVGLLPSKKEIQVLVQDDRATRRIEHWRELAAEGLNFKINVDDRAIGPGGGMGRPSDWVPQGMRAMGGAVSRGELYLVGEKGPELFQAPQSGNIVNARDTQKMLGGEQHIEINQTFNERIDPKHVAAELAWELAG